MTLERALNEFRTYLRDVERKSPKTYDGYHRDLVRYLRKLAADDDVRSFTTEAVNRVLGSMRRDGKGTATIQRMTAALHKFARWGLIQSPPLWKEDPTLHLPKISAPRRHPKPFASDELARLLALELPRQQRAVRALLVYTGMRAAALGALRPEDVNILPTTMRRPGSAVVVPGTIRSIGKGNAETIHFMQPALKDALWEQWQAAQEWGKKTLCWRSNGAPLNNNAVQHMCRLWGRKANVAHVHPHRFRHTFASEMIREGVNPAVLRTLMGHQSINTTMGYAKVDDAQAAEAALKLGASWGQPVDRSAEIAALRARLAELEGGVS